MKRTPLYLLLIVPLCFSCKELTPSISESDGNSSSSETGSEPLYEFDEDVTNASGSAYYEIFVRSFYDSNNNGLGDLKGVEEKLPYLEQLGVKGLWLMPIHPSDTYHKYDVKNYKDIDSEYGTLADFDSLIAAANTRHIDIIIDLIINHSSSNHPWFTESQNQKRNNTCSAANSKCRYYNWSDNAQDGYRWSSTANSYYEGRFDSSMPDLNLDNPYVVDEFESIVDFWLERGVKGFRLDAVTSFYTGDSVKNVQFLTTFNNYVKSKRSDAFIIGEAWENLNNVLYQYASSGMNFFNFPLSELNPNSVATNVLGKNGAAFARSVVTSEVAIRQHSQTSKNALIISNHDMDRSAGYLTGEKAKIAASAYLLSPGHPFMYYGEEIGLKGSRAGENTDANRRLAMIWDAENSTGKCNNPPGTTYNMSYQVINGVKQNLAIENSLTNHYRKVLNVRNKYALLYDGEYNYVDVGNSAIAMFEVTKGQDTLYLVHNFSDAAVTFTVPSGLAIDEKINTVNVPPLLEENGLTLAQYSSVVLK